MRIQTLCFFYVEYIQDRLGLEASRRQNSIFFFLKKKETDDGILLARAGYVVGWTKERKKGCLALGSVRQTVQLPGRANLSAEPWIPAAFCE